MFKGNFSISKPNITKEKFFKFSGLSIPQWTVNPEKKNIYVGKKPEEEPGIRLFHHSSPWNMIHVTVRWRFNETEKESNISKVKGAGEEDLRNLASLKEQDIM